MKALNWVGWISAGIGVILLIMGGISLIVGAPIIGQHIISYFNAASSFFLLTISLFIYVYHCECKK